MSPRLAITGINGQRSTCPSRADSVRRWASEGARAFAGIQGKSVYIPSRSDSVLYRGSWFGGNGACTGYTSNGVKMVLANQSAAAFRHGIVAGIIQHYKARFEYIKTKRACQILSKIGSGEDTFYWVNFDGSEDKWTPHKMLNDPTMSQLSNWRANNVSPIDFIGGPPDKWGTYRGSLRTLMLDRIAVVVLFEGLETLDSVIDPGEKCSKFA